MQVASIPAASDRPAPHFRVVGLGASAGGLEPLVQFLTSVPSASGMAYLVVQHLAPTHKALLAELLQRATTMPVQEVTDLQRIDPDAVDVIPPNTEMTVVAGMLHLAAPSRPRGQRLPIDVLFMSMAREFADRAVRVVLSGMGSDGSLGLRAIKAQGGLTLAQEPAWAQFALMPESAVKAGCVDIIALRGEMPGHILRATGMQVPTQPPEPAPREDDASGPSGHLDPAA